MLGVWTLIAIAVDDDGPRPEREFEWDRLCALAEDGGITRYDLVRPPWDHRWYSAGTISALVPNLEIGEKVFASVPTLEQSATGVRIAKDRDTRPRFPKSFCASCGNELALWFDPSRSMYAVNRDDTAFGRWLDTSCSRCGRTPRQNAEPAARG